MEGVSCEDKSPSECSTYTGLEGGVDGSSDDVLERSDFSVKEDDDLDRAPNIMNCKKRNMKEC